MLNRRTLAAWIILVLVVGAAAVAWWLPRRGPATPSAPASPSVRMSRPASAGATPQPSVSSAPAGVPSAGVPRTPWTGTVEKVNDGDTLDVRTADGLHRVRLVGIDAPELAHGSPAQCGAQASKVALRTLAQGKEVTVVPDQVGDVSDRFGRRLAYVELAGTDLGLSQVALGYAEAWAPASAAVPSRLLTYSKASTTARAAKVGNWAACPAQGR